MHYDKHGNGNGIIALAASMGNVLTEGIGTKKQEEQCLQGRDLSLQLKFGKKIKTL